MFTRWCLLTLSIVQILHADIEDYFKPVADHSESHGIRNIDFIYVINLDRRPEKWAHTLAELSPYGITPYRFSAVSGWELSLEAINELGVKYEAWMMNGRWGTTYPLALMGQHEHEIVQYPGKTYYCHCMPKGSVGIVLSHLSILQDALDNGFETIWVMEDDIEVIQNPHLMSIRIEELDALVGKDNWDILFTDQDTKGQDGNYVPCSSYAWRPNYLPAQPHRFAQREDVGPHFRKIGARYGAYSMIVRRSGMRKILNFLKCYSIFLPYDMEYTLPALIRLYAVREDIVSTQPQAISDNGSPNYLNTPTGMSAPHEESNRS